ncbi:hypothetical protein FSP39_014253 [Pinctada imbricata]|uniref:Uncharacterized protein n=1 Tax=Pinctada imbricata TaxID=66713 RepID=A0AA88XNM1_PINIB|nr:hypothetical protein FSP39_014253 [Pinctada imbricata]
MDNDDENVENNQKYSFLLGSAIRSEDTDQFFSIYDKILPANIPRDQVESIKAEARRIAELPDQEFDQLVLNARSYSLAKAKTMSHSNYPGVRLGKGGSDDDDDEVQLRPYANRETSYSSLAQDSCILDMEQFERRADNDSGFCNSSKATTSIGSNSEDSEEDDQRGCFDYVPTSHTRTGSSVKITPTYHLEYDEAHEVESDRASANDIDSPRSGKDSDNGIELRTFSRNKGNTDDDFETSDESDSEVTINKSRQNIYRNGRRSTNYYSPMKLESVDDFGDVSTSSFSFENSQRALQDRSGSSLREINVDDAVSFPIYSRHRPQTGATYGGSNYGSTSGENVRIQKSSFQRSRDGEIMGDLGPPFGSDYDHLNKVGSSIESLISGTKQTVEGMPEGRPISQTLDLADSRRKSKRKKKTSKDDSEDRVKPKRYSDGVDENGNPALTESSPLLGGPSSYYHMREQPIRHIARKNDGHSNFPSRVEHLNSFPFNGQSVRELDDPSSNNYEKLRKKKAKKEKGVERKAEDVENYVGNKELDELLSFIESDGTRNSKNSRKVPCSDTQSEKNKRNKEKKHRTIQEKVEGKVNDKKDKNDELVIKNCVPSLTPDSVKDKSEEGYHSNMGNSTAKIEEIEADHSIMEGGTGKEEKLETISDLQKEVSEDNNKHTVVKEVLSNNSKKEIEVVNEEENQENEIHKVIAVEEAKKEISLPNGVKRNNVKNSKKKTASKGKEEASSNGPKPVSSTAGLTHPQDFVDNSIYIFTDIDSLKPVEEEFKVVGKKKKKGVNQVKEHTPKEVVPIMKPFQKEERIPRSITPPPRSMERVMEHSPDLSLSSFPELANPRQGRQIVREGRRNSTGDVPKEINLKVHDDSDIESVKSLPAASQALSPRLPMSYAKMAASPAPGGSSQASLSTDTEGVIGSEMEKGSELKSAVWKGSITERRHSIGSSPDGKEIETQTTKQKFGSQEALSKINDQDVGAAVQSAVKSDAVTQDDTFVEESEKVLAVAQELPASHSQHQFESASESSQVDNSMSETNLKLSSSMHSLPPDPKVIPTNSVYISPKTSKTSLAKTTNHKKSIKSNQSVVFLDKRVKIPQNLDITFGFLDSEDKSDPALEVEVQNSASDIQPTYVSHNLSSVSIGSDIVTENVPSANMTGEKLPANKPSPNPCSSSNKLINSDFNMCDSAASKAICELENKNGIINHRQKHQNVQCTAPATASFSFINDPEEISVCDAAKISASDETSIASGDGNLTDNEKLYKSRKNSILVHFGDCLRCVVGEDNKGHIEFVPEKEEIVHHYNREDVIGFLHRAAETANDIWIFGWPFLRLCYSLLHNEKILLMTPSCHFR